MKEINEFPLIPSIYGTGEKLRISENFLQRRRVQKKRNPEEKKEPGEPEPTPEEQKEKKRLEITV